MNNFSNIQTRQAVSHNHAVQTGRNNAGVQQQAFSGQIFGQRSQPQFNQNILQLLFFLIQQLLQLIGDEKPEPPQNPILNPNQATREKLANILGVPAETVKVTDRDGNGQLSAGDLIEGTVSDDIGQPVAVSYELNALALQDVNNELGDAIAFPTSDRSRVSLNNVVGVQSGATDLPRGRFIEKVLDSDDSGRISAGDVVAIRSTGIPPFTLEYVKLTADQVQQFENQAYGSELALSNDELGRLEVIALAGLPVPSVVGRGISISRTFDSNGDGKLSVGDVIEVKRTLRSQPDQMLIDTSFQYLEVTQDIADRFNQTANDPVLPPTVSGAGVTVGQSNHGDIIPDDRVISIAGRNYSVGFLKQQVADYANSPYGEPPSGGVAAAIGTYPWGQAASVTYFASQFEGYVSDTFPFGEPGLPANPPVRYENNTLIVNGQAYEAASYASTLTSNSSLVVQSGFADPDEVRQFLNNNFSELSITGESVDNLIGGNSVRFEVDGPTNYLSQWRQALEGNLPDRAFASVPV